MSYLNYPRLHFAGKFQAAPATINNTPNNYNSNNYYYQDGNTALDQAANPEQLKNIELYWNPNGNGVFNFVDCIVTKVVYEDGSEATTAAEDPIIGQSVAAVYSAAPPKMVDLDPMQQGVSEIWGLELQVAGISAANPNSIPDSIRGRFTPTPFNGIWPQALNGPRSSASASAVYQGQLLDLTLENQTEQSPFITQISIANPSALSLNFVVNAHNNSPPIYSFNEETFFTMLNEQIPLSVVEKLRPLALLIQNVGRTKGDIPTESYVNFLLSELLEKSEYEQYKPTILEVTKQKYTPSTSNKFTFGDVTGTIGLSGPKAPVYFVPSRMMAPYQNTGNAFFAPFDVVVNSQKTQATVTLNLGNSLVTCSPGPLANSEVLGKLSLVYFEAGQPATVKSATTLAEIPYQSAEFKTQSSGFFSYKTTECNLVDVLQQNPLGIISEVAGETSVLLAENQNGYFIRANRFVYRMNPGIATTQEQPFGSMASVNIHVLQFGQPASSVDITLTMKSPQKAIDYTVNTLATSGTQGIGCLSMPQSALQISPQTVATTDTNGVAIFELTASDPGNPRGYVDGQVYFLDYGFANETINDNYVAEPNDLISVHVYQQMVKSTGTKPDYIPTWDGDIHDILSQYGKLYPIMSRFGLQSYESVVKNAGAIRTVLEKPIEDALYMPVIRDLSYDRLQLVLYWMDNNMPETTADIK
jgi:hypothetical protein